MAHIRKRTLASGKVAYQLRYIDPAGRERSEQFARRGDAQARLTEVESAKRAGTYVDPARGRTTFREYAEHWRSVQVHRESSATQRERELRLHVYPRIGSRQLASLRRSDLQGLVAQLSAQLAPNTTRGVWAAVDAVLRAAVLDGLIAQSPAVHITLPRPVGAELLIPTAEQAAAIAAAVPVRLRGLVWAAATTGLRRGELLGMTLRSLDLLRRTVTVSPDRGQLVTPKGQPARLGPPKTSASARTVPLGTVAVEQLSRHLRDHPAEPADGYGGLVFRGVRRPWLSESFYDHIAPAVRAQGFPPGTGLHIFRHFYASALIAGGDMPKVVQVRLGHASITETMDTYGHLWPDSEEQSRKAIDAAFDVGQGEAQAQ